MAQTTALVLCQSQLVATVNDHSNAQANATLLPLDNSHLGQGVAVGGLPPAPLGSRRRRRSSGIYFYRLETTNGILTRKFTLLR